MSKIRNLVHIVLTTYKRMPVIDLGCKREMYAYLYGILKNYQCRVLRINGMAEHIHILMDLHQLVALADVVKEMKRCSTIWARTTKEFYDFPGWGDGYFAVSVSPDDVESVKMYIMSQESHHSGKDYDTEMRDICAKYGVAYDPRDWGNQGNRG